VPTELFPSEGCLHSCYLQMRIHVSVSRFQSVDGRVIGVGELERIWKEVMVGQSRYNSGIFLKRRRKTKKSSQPRFDPNIFRGI
jgi:hypothetical protein